MSRSRKANVAYLADLPKPKSLVAQPKKAYIQFNLVFLAAVLLPLVSIGLFNVAIDPYGIFNSPKFTGINQVKSGKEYHDRLFKAIDIERIKPITILLGSSRTKQGLNPAHPALKSNQPAYNLGLNGANPYEQLRYLQHAIKNNNKLKMVIIGIDFFMFDAFNTNQPDFSEDRLEKQNITLQDATSAIFSLDAVDSSIKTIMASIREPEKEVSNLNGFMPYQHINLDKAVTEWRFQNSIRIYLKLHPKYNFSTKYLSDFKAIVDICKQHGITLKVFISPAHATDEETIRATGDGPTLETWKREIAKIVPFRDFSGYNSITTEPIGGHMRNYADSSHYREEIGNLVLNRILSYQEKRVPEDFGVLITPTNIEEHLAKIRADREEWVKNNPEAVNLVQDLKRDQDRKLGFVSK